MTVTLLKRPESAPKALIDPAETPVMRAADAPATPTSAGVARRRRLLIGGGLVLALAVGAAATQYLNVWQYQQSTDNAYVRADITPVAAKVDGYVATVAIADNQRVKAGDLLVRIDPSDYAAKVAAATANLATARANLAQARAAAVGAGSQLGAQVAATGVARANLTATQAAAVKANADAVRYRDLAKSGWVTRAQLDQVNAAAASAVANVAAARAAIVQAQGVTGVSVSGRVKAAADIEAAQAQVAAAQAALASARLDLGRTELRAPVDGIVGNRSVRPGQLVRNGAQLLSVVPVQAAYVVANFKETQLDHMKAGQPVEIAVDAYPGLHLSGRVESLAPTSGAQFALIPTDTATGNFTKIVQRVPVRITIDRTQLGAELLRPGLSVEATVNTRG